ncbi:MAG: S-layer homology domain-containing protein, partial [Hominilimicola sp.]
TEEEIKISNGSNAGGNGFVETPTPTTAPTATDKPTMTDIPQTERFSDIASVPWAREAILTLAERGVISGTGETTYSPQNPIRRADFVMLLVRLLDIDGRITDTFDDVAADKYYYESVNLAKSMGIISGIGENKFNPEGRITRQDMMTMTYRALSKLNMTDTTTADLSVFSDADKVADYAYSSISYLAGKGYVSGDDMGNLNPVSDTTRAETAIFLYKLGI